MDAPFFNLPENVIKTLNAFDGGTGILLHPENGGWHQRGRKIGTGRHIIYP
jgi:hypothetical protein